MACLRCAMRSPPRTTSCLGEAERYTGTVSAAADRQQSHAPLITCAEPLWSFASIPLARDVARPPLMRTLLQHSQHGETVGKTHAP